MNKIMIFDGAMGTMLQNAGLPIGSCPELWNLTNPAGVTAVHAEYIAAGSDIIETNTFGASRLQLAEYGLADKVIAINQTAVAAARAACVNGQRVAGSVGPSGQLIHPLGSLSYSDAYAAFYEQAEALITAGVDYLIIETMTDIQEMRIALLAARTISSTIPIICQLSYQPDGRTLTGSNALSAYVTLSKLGASIIGANCSVGPAEMLPIITTLASQKLPVSAQPNAGLPKFTAGKTSFPMLPDEFAAWGIKLAEAGASFLGGCCGTTPQHIRALKKALQGFKPATRSALPTNKVVCLSSRSTVVSLGAGLQPQIIGERINPTGRKALSSAIKVGDFTGVRNDAVEQQRAGAALLDVNMGVPNLDPAATMKTAINELDGLVDCPLVIDTTSAAALEAGLQSYAGRALINSVSAETERLNTFLPLAKKYGAAILCLPVTDEGVPTTADERLSVVKQIVAAAKDAGLDDDDIMLDPLVLTIGSEGMSGLITLDTLGRYRRELGYPTAMGLSNVSFGLPRRDIINAQFLGLALLSGLDAPILNPFDAVMQSAWRANLAILAHDSGAVDYSQQFAQGFAPANTQPAPTIAPTIDSTQTTDDVLVLIRQTVISGGKQAVLPLIDSALKQFTPLEITDNGLTAAMTELGSSFAAGRVFLPQVLLAAETMRIAFDELKRRFPDSGRTAIGTVLLATVKGDIHDLGKNIVAALLNNNGFNVIDLGKDVAAETILEAIAQHKPDIVGLSALMTTTLPQCGVTISAIRSAGYTLPIVVGGAVFTAEYAREQGADYYAADAVSGVELMKKLCNNK